MEMNFIVDMLMNVVTGALILIAGYFIGEWVSKTIKNVKKLDGTLKSFLGGLAKYAIIIFAVVTVLTQFGVQTASMIAVLGAAGLAIGLSLQGTLSNVASGVMLLFLRPFNVGDFVTAGSVSGTVKSLGLFVTEFTTGDNVYISVPNSQIANSAIQNFSRNTTRRMDLVFGVSYDDDINKAMKTIEKVLKKEKRLLDAEDKQPKIMVSNLGDSSVDITARIWCGTPDFWAVKWDLTKAIKEQLDKDGLTIPFPTQTIEYADSAKPANQSSKKKAA